MERAKDSDLIMGRILKAETERVKDNLLNGELEHYEHMDDFDSSPDPDCIVCRDLGFFEEESN